MGDPVWPHRPDRTWHGDEVINGPYCSTCSYQAWPCDAEQMRLERDAERARTVVLRHALRGLVEAWDGGGDPDWFATDRTVNAALKQARAALAVLPVDRVGVEPLDVARLYNAIRRIAMREGGHPGHDDLRAGLTTPGLGHGYEVTLAAAIAEEYGRGA